MAATAAVAALVALLLPAWAAADGPPMVSTRGVPDATDADGNAAPPDVGTGEEDISLPSDVTDCPESLTIFVHGHNNSESDAEASTAAVAAALSGAGYSGTVAGYSWSSDSGGFSTSKHKANAEGKKLANVLKAIKKHCEEQGKTTKIHLIAHSLGARVVLVALKCGGCACSVQLIAAAVPKWSFWGGNAFVPSLDNTHMCKVWHNPDDDALGLYGVYTGGSAMGDDGAKGVGNNPKVENCCYEDKLKDSDDHGVKDILKGGKLAECLAKFLIAADEAAAAEAAEAEAEQESGEEDE